MGFYSVRGRTTASMAPVSDSPLAVLWNPHATKRLRVIEVGMSFVGTSPGPSKVYIRRTTTRGTPGATVTPDIQQSFHRTAAPVSGTILDLAVYTVDPTFEGGANGLSWVSPANVSWIIIYSMPEGMEISPGNGLALVDIGETRTIPVAEVWFCWEE